MRRILRILVALVIVCLLYPAAVLAFYIFAPRSNAKLGKVDSLVVLGCPTKKDGTPTPEQRERVLEAVREYKAGASDHIIMTGAAAHNQFVEAHAMAQLAEQNGVPESAIIEEGQAKDTIQNIYYTNQILQQHGWKSIEVISSPYHLPRTRLILLHYPALQWKEVPADWPEEYSWWDRWTRSWGEANGSFKLITAGFRKNKYLPGS